MGSRTWIRLRISFGQIEVAHGVPPFLRCAVMPVFRRRGLGQGRRSFRCEQTKYGMQWMLSSRVIVYDSPPDCSGCSAFSPYFFILYRRTRSLMPRAAAAWV